MQRITKHSRAALLVVGMLAIGGALLVGCLGQRPSPTRPSEATVQPAGSPVQQAARSSKIEASQPNALTTYLTPTAQRHTRYGVMYPYRNSWSEADRPAIRERLAYLRELGVGVVAQVFPSELAGTNHEQDWFIFLDEAQAQGIQVIARLWPPHDWDGVQFDFRYVKRFLTTIEGHPAVLAYFGLHEPLETFSGDQLRTYYQAVKSFAPHTPILHAMSNIASFEADPRFSDRRFTDGMCDLCAIWYYPFRVVDGQAIFERQRVGEVITANDALVRARDPDAQLWFLAQTYAMEQHSPPLRMPSADEMSSLADVALEGWRIDGLLWYPWLHSSYDQVLGDPALAAQQQAVQTVYYEYLLKHKGFLPLVIK